MSRTYEPITMPMQQLAGVLVAIWQLLVGVRFRASRIVLVGGFFVTAGIVLAASAAGMFPRQALGFHDPPFSPYTLGLTAVWLALMYAYSPVADWLATRLVAKPPTLGAFRALQQSRSKLVMGILIAWFLGGLIEEIVLCGILLNSIDATAARWLQSPLPAAIAISGAALGAGIIHLYQGLRAALVTAQLSVLFGLLFVLSSRNLWPVVVCHGLYDTVAFIRFAKGRSKYSRFPENGQPGADAW